MFVNGLTVASDGRLVVTFAGAPNERACVLELIWIASRANTAPAGALLRDGILEKKVRRNELRLGLRFVRPPSRARLFQFHRLLVHVRDDAELVQRRIAERPVLLGALFKGLREVIFAVRQVTDYHFDFVGRWAYLRIALLLRRRGLSDVGEERHRGLKILSSGLELAGL